MTNHGDNLLTYPKGGGWKTLIQKYREGVMRTPLHKLDDIPNGVWEESQSYTKEGELRTTRRRN